LKVAALHPLLADLARQVGGDHVDVFSLLKPGMELHRFEPSAQDLADLKGVQLVLACGKGAEGYLGKLRDSLRGTAKIVEVGRTIPSLKSASGAMDPHWWHSPDYMKRAARVVADEFYAADPANKADYLAHAKSTGQRIDALKFWAQQQFTQIPKRDRILVSAHNAFAYFCRDFGFITIPVLGLSAEDEPSPHYITDAIKVILENHVRAVFPEQQANPKTLEAIARETGVKIGAPLNADGTTRGAGSTFEGMIRHNVEAIVAALRP
jgi:zinc/manganese transport system substrate-binding protein